MKNDRPLALLIQPPVYDFALYDLYLKPYGLLRIGRWLAEGGWEVVFVNGLQYNGQPSDPDSERSSAPTISPLSRPKNLGFRYPKRKADGTGKFIRMPVKTPEILEPLLKPRIERGEWRKRFARYGVPEEVFRQRIRNLKGDVWGTEEFTNGEGRHPDLILISTGMTYWYLGLKEAAQICREEHPNSVLFVGGVYATLLPEHCLKSSQADGVIRGENLEPLKQILHTRGLPIPDEPVPDRPIPFPSVWKEAGVIRLNTGCPLRCSYCASGLLTPRFKPGNPEKAWAALQEMYECCGTRNFAFYDDALLFRKEEVLLPFLEGVIQGQEKRCERVPSVRFYLPNGVHVNSLDMPTAQLMRRAGVAEIRLGFESASDEFHRKYDGKVKAAEFSEAVSRLKQAGYEAQDISVYILAGLPEQEAEEVEASIRFVKPLGVRIRIAEYSPVPSTPLWRESVQRCPFPLDQEPLFHNNSLFSLEGEHFPYSKLLVLKGLAAGES
ncbi:MAG: radical SAM protein [Spirochaetes bacterium]|nr:radical SAM protein [Spirochaetota bacterium]